jgi:hypothetical protein
VIDPHVSASYDTGIAAHEVLVVSGATGIQATDEWNSESYDENSLPLGTRLYEFHASGNAGETFDTNYHDAWWCGTPDTWAGAGRRSFW